MTLKQRFEQQLRYDIEIGMSFEKDSPEDHFWRGVVTADKKALEILNGLVVEKIDDIARFSPRVPLGEDLP